MSRSQPPRQRTPAALVAQLQADLLAWFAEHGRDLPWRRTRDPYFVLVSEVMLQQIQVSRAIPFYERFVQRFPTVSDLAAAPRAEVIRVWGDLGRYRRIAFLHEAARLIVDEHGGVVPSGLAALRRLPGVGPYTAGAVACFAYERDVAFVDTNIRRVFARALFGVSSADEVEERRSTAAAERLLAPGRAWAWNSALMDLGATVCLARRPRCAACPLAEACVVRKRGGPSAASSRAAGGLAFRYETSDRYYRGRVLGELRGLTEGEEAHVELETLGAAIREDFGDEHLAWLDGLVRGLERDGLAVIAEERDGYRVEDDSTVRRRVRLP